jgi:hypothetical protein
VVHAAITQEATSTAVQPPMFLTDIPPLL